MKPKSDLRIIKTQMNIYNALTNLLKVKSFENIKVSDICSEALINRSTFYDHYTDKYELLIDFINNQKKLLEEALNNNDSFTSIKDYYIELIKLLLNHVEENISVYQSIVLNNENSVIMNIFIDVITKDVENKILKAKRNNASSKIITKFYVGAVVNVCMEWLINNHKYKKEDIIKNLQNLIPEDINNL